MRIKISVTGIVQGVGFRPFVYRTAVKNGLSGYVRNRGDAGAEILVEGTEEAIRSFLRDVEKRKPPLAQIHGITTKKLEGKTQYGKFTIKKSSGEIELSGSVIPPDIAICNDCLRELRDQANPRYEYFFITCTNCGPRFTIIEKLPYDRENTTMREFSMCGFCLKEYSDPLNRRFHAQTVACPNCGPKVYMTTREGRETRHRDPVREAGKLLSEGFTLAIKGYGGFHIATSVTEEKPLTKLRRAKHRSQKPFAIMARSIEATKSFAEVSKSEAELLTSYTRPIVLLNKSNDYYLSNLIAPQLHNVGVMLPYTALHNMLFDKVDDAAFVMTSANPPNQPITKDNEEALSTLGETVDYFLFHNRQISHRCDDSVIRMHDRNKVLLRRSRGYAPAPIMLRRKAKRCVVALGGELNNTSCILNANKAFISQHIGDVENIETKQFLMNETNHLINLTNVKPEAVACDLHPKFTTTALAHKLTKGKLQLAQVQHHYAHIAALMAEHDLNEIVGICCDGYGYGTDGEAWGGEVLYCQSETFGFKRLAHLERQPLIGGDLAARYPLRVAAGILRSETDAEKWLLQGAQHFPHGKQEVRIILQQLERDQGVVMTTSCGRILDAAAAILGLCYERTYEGEPAMKLESMAARGKDALKLEPTFKGNALGTTRMLSEIFEKRLEYPKADLAYSVHAYLAKGLSKMAIKSASEYGVETIGFSGGAASNEILTSIMRATVKGAGLRFLVHEVLPPGDGGLSFGQAVAVGFPKIEP